MELERNAIPEDESNEGHREATNLFEQTVLLTVQSSCISALYECAFDAYPRFHKSEGNSKGTVIRIRWNRKKYLFGEKFEEKLLKIITVK